MGTATATSGFRSFQIKETFHTPMGTATHCLGCADCVVWKHFIPLWGQQRDGEKDTGINRGKHFIPLRGQQRDLRGQLLRNDRKHFIPHRGQQQPLSAPPSIFAPKHFIPLWGQKENRYVQLDISVFTLSARVIHILRRPYRAPF